MIENTINIICYAVIVAITANNLDSISDASFWAVIISAFVVQVNTAYHAYQ